MKLGKKLCRTVKKSFSLVLALTLMLSVCAMSGMSLNVFAATSLDQKIYINLNKNKEWNGFSSVTCRFAQDDGTVLKTEKVSKDPSPGVFKTIAPSGATKIELSSGVNFTLPEKTVANGSRRIYLNNSNNTYKEAYAYSWVNEDDFNAEWPGAAMTKTSSDSDYYYVDVKSSHKNVIFSNKGETQTSDLGINDSYSADNALYDASKSQWTNPFIKTIDISGATGDTEFYLSTDGSFKESKYLSVQAPDKQSKAEYKTVYVSNDDWKSLTKVYATFDYNDAYEGTVELTKDTKDTKVSGSVVFKGKIPAGALLRFHPNEHNLNGASSATSYPTDSGYDGSGYSDNTATYVKTARGEGWTKFSEIDNVNYGAVVENSFKDNPNIVGVDATYFDYWSDMEQANGYLQCQGNDNMYDYWYQFDNFNSYISNIALDHKSDWKYPLYFGNMYKGGEHYKEFTDHVAGLTNINDYNDNYYYAVNNANGMAWGDGNYNQSLQGLMYNRLDSKGNLQVANGVKAPYFDAEALSTATYNDKRVANVYKSSFPFRATTDGDGVTTYEFTSKNATDNIYFTWDGLTPKKINYGAGETYGVHDDLGKFGGTENGYGVFPFNNTQNTSAGKGTNCNLNYGFGVRLDIDFRVPKGGLLADNKPATFNFSGDDDLWVYIGEDSTGADAELALDLGGDHKEASGSIDFNKMQATADDVFADYSPSSSSTKLTVPEGEFWVKTGDYNNFCLNVWQDTKVGVYNEDGYYVDPYEISDGFYKFKKDLLGSNTEVNFCKWKNMGTGGTLKANLKLSDLYGKMWNGDGTPYTGDALSHPIIRKPVTKTINNGVQLDPNKTYHMVVFYMERGEAESNFKVNFTMTPANNDLKVTKALDTGDVVSEISDDLKANEAFDYTIKENDKDTSGKGYKLTKPDKSTSSETLLNSGFTLKDDYMADFDNSFKTDNNMTVDESTDSSKLKYTTNWELVNNRVGSTIKSGSTANSEFKLVDPEDDSAYAQLQLNYTNSIMTAPLEISKNVVNEDGETDYDTNQQFTFAIALDFDGSDSTYDYKTYPLEYQLKEKDASGYSNTVYRTSKDGSFTIKKGESIKLLNIPVGATYKITEKNVIGYVPYKVGNQDFNGTFVGTLAEAGNALKFINKVNPTNIAISVNKTLDGQAYSGSKFVYTLTGLESMDTAKQDADGNIIKTNSAKTISTNLKTPDKNGKVEFKNLKLVTAGVYRFKITEALAEGENASDYKMDTNTWLAEIELRENGKVTAPKYIKVSSSAIKDKTDAELAEYFNNSTSVDKAEFENKTTHGSATVNKKNQTGGNVSDTEFAVMKVSGEGIFTADDINTIIKDATMKTHMVSKTTDSNGQAVFDKLTIFKDGQGEFTKTNGKVVWNESSDNYITGTSKYQTYCLFEYKPSEGYTPNYTLSYFTLPVEGNYDVTYNYVDGAITMPSASGDGMNGYVVLGLSVAGLAVTMFTGYAIYYGKVRKKRRAGRRK
ncbi:starch-binding protein [Ruminococcus bromii]|nr:starch-binding protein [Ruminococcus bromii]MTQ93972.1 starch-binding protein [Ruminococcus bromii]MTR79013.1 starch-binding protein [Ruminococcus bromii]MTR88132.1 starch-binding protein [Ruminococcus bromii]